jgi:hypothetical protein
LWEQNIWLWEQTYGCGNKKLEMSEQKIWLSEQKKICLLEQTYMFVGKNQFVYENKSMVVGSKTYGCRNKTNF